MTSLRFLMILLPVSIMAAEPVLSFPEGANIDLGWIAAHRPHRFDVRLHNRGIAPLHIFRLVAGCDCLTMEVVPMPVPPGADAVLRIKLKPESFHGEFKQNIAVYSNAAAAPVIIELTGYAIPLLEARPSSRFYTGNIPAGESWEVDVTIYARESGVILAEPRSGGVSPDRLVLERIDGYRWKLAVSFSAAAGRDFRSRIVIPVDEPVGARPLELDFSGGFGAELRAEPAILLVPAAPEKPFTRVFALSLGGEQRFDADKLIFPSLPGVSFRVLGRERRRITVEMERRETEGAEASALPESIFIEYPAAAPAELKLSTARFLR